jgi:SAM-dependent methyltransferase
MEVGLKTSVCSRRFHWMSSIAGQVEVLAALNQKMSWFYGQMSGRAGYQEMISAQEDVPFSEESVRHQMPKYICDLHPANVLEIGCGDGRIYRQLCGLGYAGAYCGIEVADYIIQLNRQRHPATDWRCANAYEIPFEDDSFELCFSLYVLEHLVYPERALREMLRVLVPGGRLVLVFPDFVEAGRLASQKLGFSPVGSASQKLRSGKFLDALASLFDSRVRLRKALKCAVAKYGPFPVNTRPLCLSYPDIIGADVDAVYIASKREVHDWARAHGHRVEYPCGTAGEFAEQAFLTIVK